MLELRDDADEAESGLLSAVGWRRRHSGLAELVPVFGGGQGGREAGYWILVFLGWDVMIEFSVMGKSVKELGWLNR